MGADRQDGADLVIDRAEEESRQINARGREQGEAFGPRSLTWNTPSASVTIRPDV
jgi:hypothetical protein